MGCGASRPEGGGAVAFPPRLRPLFLHRWEDIRLRRHSSALKPTLSKKELLLATDDDENQSSFKTAVPVTEKSSPDDGDDGSKEKRDDRKKSNDQEEEEEKFYTDVENDDDDDDDGRMIGRGDDGLGSPSFRVYFNEDDRRENVGDDDRGRSDGKIDSANNFISIDDHVSCDETASSKESNEEGGSKKPTSRRKRRSFRKVFPKGEHVRNLLNVKSCYTPPSSYLTCRRYQSRHRQAREDNAQIDPPTETKTSTT